MRTKKLQIYMIKQRRGKDRYIENDKIISVLIIFLQSTIFPKKQIPFHYWGIKELRILRWKIWMFSFFQEKKLEDCGKTSLFTSRNDVIYLSEIDCFNGLQ